VIVLKSERYRLQYRPNTFFADPHLACTKTAET